MKILRFYCLSIVISIFVCFFLGFSVGWWAALGYLTPMEFQRQPYLNFAKLWSK